MLFRANYYRLNMRDLWWVGAASWQKLFGWKRRHIFESITTTHIVETFQKLRLLLWSNERQKGSDFHVFPHSRCVLSAGFILVQFTLLKKRGNCIFFRVLHNVHLMIYYNTQKKRTSSNKFLACNGTWQYTVKQQPTLLLQKMHTVLWYGDTVCSLLLVPILWFNFAYISARIFSRLLTFSITLWKKLIKCITSNSKHEEITKCPGIYGTP